MKDIMNFGIEEARRTMNENKGGPFGAVITDSEGNIISVASNRVLELHDATAHAEVMAIREAGKILVLTTYLIVFYMLLVILALCVCPLLYGRILRKFIMVLI